MSTNIELQNGQVNQSVVIMSTVGSAQLALRRLQQGCYITIGAIIIHLIVAIVGYAVPCLFGMYVSSMLLFGNSFWIAIPLLILVAATCFIIRHGNLPAKQLWYIKAGAIICLIITLVGIGLTGWTLHTLFTASATGFNINLVCFRTITFGHGSTNTPMQEAIKAAIGVAFSYILYLLLYCSSCFTILNVPSSGLNSVANQNPLGNTKNQWATPTVPYSA